MDVLGYLASIGIGIVLGLLGGGGSILAIPILVYLFHVDAVLASAYSLFIVGVTSFVGAIPKYKDHLVNLRTGFLFGLPSIVAIFSTRHWIVPSIPEIIFQSPDLIVTKRFLLLGLFAILMIMASYSLIKGNRQLESEDHKWKIWPVVVEGIIIGFLTGLVGAGGGFLIIPALVWLTGLPFKTAVGTSLFIIAVNSLLGFLGDVLNYQMNWDFLLIITGLAVFGILIGHQLHKKLSATLLRKMFGWFILAMGIGILVKEYIGSNKIM
jgi:uncharacterized membrane protein YfcA